MFSLSKSACLTPEIQIQLSWNRKTIFQFFLHFQNISKILNTLENKMSLTGDLSLKFQAGKSLVIWMPKNPCVRTLVGSQHVKGSKTVLNSAGQYFCHIFWWVWKKISSKNSDLVVPEILRLFVNILTPDEKYPLSVKAHV